MNVPQPSLRTLAVSDGVSLSFRHFPPAGELRGYLVAWPGIQSHSGWYERSSARLATAGYDVRFFDRRGSGESAGLRGHAPHWERLLNDAAAALAEVGAERDAAGKRVPVVQLGLSWGGRLAAVVAAERPALCDALALLYPGICARIEPGPLRRLQLLLARALGIRYRRAAIPLGDPALFTDDPRAQEFIRRDPLALRQATAGFFLADRELRRRALASGERLRLPVLMLLAGRDRIVDTPASRAFFERLAACEKQLIEFSDATHTLEFDECFEDFIAALIAWLDNVACQFGRRGDAHQKDPAVATAGS